MIVSIGVFLSVLTPLSASGAEQLGLSASTDSGYSSGSVVVAGENHQVAAMMNARPIALTGFTASNIISDAVFYDGGAMSSSEIQRFLEQRVASCGNDRCIRNLTASISSRSAVYSARTGNLVCNAIPGGTNLRVSEIIYRAQVACGISAKVILATLQKEQGLVTNRAPSAWNIQQAMGAFCPDTSPCDPAYAGIGAQILSGTIQLKTYRAGAFSRQPGVHYIGWHPNASCGGTNLTIANYATAALYNYTPYQPNAAAIRAGYGVGDGCSSYGNRNFYNYFTDWFGSTQSASSAMVKVGPDVYFLSGATRFHIMPSVLAEYVSAFGTPATVAQSYLDLFSDGGRAALFIRNASSGQVAMLQGGQKHWFGSCALVAVWGGACEAETRMTSTDYARIPAGADMSSYARTANGGRIHLIEGTVLTPIYDPSSAALINGGSVPYAAVLSSAASSKLDTGVMRFAPGRFITVGSSSRVLLPSRDGRLTYLPSWSLAAEFGLPSSVYRTSVPAQIVAGFTDSSRIGLFAKCSNQIYYAAGGELHEVAAAAAEDFPITVLDSATCAVLDKSASSALANVFVQPRGENPVYMAVDGVYRHVTSPAVLAALGGGSRPVVLELSAAVVNTLPKGPKLSSADRIDPLPDPCAAPSDTAAAKRQYVVAPESTSARVAPHVACTSGATTLTAGTLLQAIAVTSARDWLQVSTAAGNAWIQRSAVRYATEADICVEPSDTRPAVKSYVVLTEGSAARSAPVADCPGAAQLAQGTVVRAVAVTAAKDWLKVSTQSGDLWMPRGDLRYATAEEMCPEPTDTRVAVKTYVVRAGGATGRVVPALTCSAGAAALSEGVVASAVAVTAGGDWLKVSYGDRELWVVRSDVDYTTAP